MENDAAALFDMHCHLGFCADAPAVADGLARRGVAGGLCCTVLPQEREGLSQKLSQSASWLVGVGLHPWWVGEPEDTADAEASNVAKYGADDPQVELARRLVSAGPCLVGEVGLDAGKRHAHTLDAQLAALTSVLDAVRAGSVLSLHSVRSAAIVLDLLEESGLTNSCSCIFHWYSDDGSSLARAVRAGCLFSVGPLMLRSRRGREYARQLPLRQLLLETDYPEQSGHASADETAEEMAEALQSACEQIAALRGMEATALAERLADSSLRVIRGLAR